MSRLLPIHIEQLCTIINAQEMLGLEARGSTKMSDT